MTRPRCFPYNRNALKWGKLPLRLEDLLHLGEGWDLEFKKAGGRDGRGALPASVWETYSAMANSYGGTIVLGVEERTDGSLQVLGIAEADKVERDLWNCLHDRNKLSAGLLARDDVKREALDGKEILILRIPRASRGQRPVYINNNPMTGTYIRGYEGDRKCSPEEVRRMLADADASHPRDSRALPGHTLADLDPESLSAYRQLFRLSSPDHPFLAENDLGLLRKLSAWQNDKAGGGEGPTLAALLLLGREEAIRAHLPDFHLDYRELPSDEEAESGVRWLDRLTLDGSWQGNLLGFYRRVIPKLVAGLKVPFHLEPDLLRRDETHAHTALREALLNSLVHADYTTRSAIRIFRRPDGFEFLNPGTLLLSIDLIRAGGASECRNPTLQHMLRLIGIGEKAGSGFPAILRAWREQHWRAPQLEDDMVRNETRLRLTMTSLLPAETLEALDRRFGDHFRRLEEDARLALATAWTEGRVTNSRLQELSNRHSRDLTGLLTDLVDRGFLVPHAQRRARWYTVPEAPERPSSEQTSEHFAAASVQSSVHFPEHFSEGSSEHFAAISEQSSVQSSEHFSPVSAATSEHSAAPSGRTLEQRAVLLRVHRTRY
ncbi:MAG TPA: RNA-binding domain-containing protein, partial [Thermoanaerobaculia bacterium]|nr:RNA-binding domain-containing protein [Thermoanaerobaculia bacterium]